LSGRIESFFLQLLFGKLTSKPILTSLPHNSTKGRNPFLYLLMILPLRDHLETPLIYEGVILFSRFLSGDEIMALRELHEEYPSLDIEDIPRYPNYFSSKWIYECPMFYGK
jgi:hypothetical protein